MSRIDALRERFPEAARDIKLNLQNVLQQSSLTPAQQWGVAIASAIAARNLELRDAIMANAQSDELRVMACKQGMVSLREAGIKACFDGTSTPDEVVRETILEA